MNAATLGVCAPNIVARHVQRLRMCIAKGAWGAFRVPGSVTYRYWPLYCSSRVRGNLHARFLGGWARATAPGHPPRSTVRCGVSIARGVPFWQTQAGSVLDGWYGENISF